MDGDAAPYRSLLRLHGEPITGARCSRPGASAVSNAASTDSRSTTSIEGTASANTACGGSRNIWADATRREELQQKFEIADLDTHQFTEIVSRHNPNETTPLRTEMQRFSDIINKEAFDEVLHEYGRSLKPDLITSMWGHSSGDFGNPPRGTNDERAMLPSELWGKDESYLWYCLGKQEPTLQLRYLRASFDDKPYTVCHYENVKIRASMAELMANGGAPMAKYINFTDPAARKELVRYYQFVKRYDDVFRANRPYGEALLLHPRSQNHQGKLIPAMTLFQYVGNKLMDEHVLFDVYPDEIVTSEQKDRYREVYAIGHAQTIDNEAFDQLQPL